MNRTLRLIIMTCIAVVAVSTTLATAAEYIDIEQSEVTGGVRTSVTLQQTFVPSVNNITAVSLFVRNGATTTIELQILDGLCGEVLAHGSGTGQDWVKCDLVGAQALIPGNTYTISISPNVEYLGNSIANPYADGDMWMNCTSHFEPSRDLQFRTWTNQDAIPTDQSTWGTVKAMYR